MLKCHGKPWHSQFAIYYYFIINSPFTIFVIFRPLLLYIFYHRTSDLSTFITTFKKLLTKISVIDPNPERRFCVILMI